MNKQRLRQLFVLLGAVFFLFLLQKAGWSRLLHDFQQMGWLLLLIITLSGIKYLLSTLAWSAAFGPQERHPLLTLFGARLAGEAMNYLSIAGPFLSEPVKATLVQRVGFTNALSTTLVETTANTITASVVSVAGLLLMSLYFVTGFALRLAEWGLIVLLLALCSGLIYGLQRQLPFLTGPGKRLGRVFRSSTKFAEKLGIVEERMHQLSAERPRDLLLIFLYSLAAQGLALAEIYLALLPSGIRLSFAAILIIEAFTKLAKAIFFFVPARIGADEGSSAGIFALLSLPPSVGLTLALVRRLRAICWSAMGLLFLFAWHLKLADEKEVLRPVADSDHKDDVPLHAYAD